MFVFRNDHAYVTKVSISIIIVNTCKCYKGEHM